MTCARWLGCIFGLAAALWTLAGPPVGAATIERVPAGRPDVALFVLNGTIEGGETLALQREVAKLPPQLPVSIILNSPGGNLIEGLALGRFLYDAKITTFTMGFGGLCASACSIAFLGGRDRVTGKPARVKMTGGRLGFHQFRTVWERRTTATTFSKKDMDFVIRDTRATALLIIKYLTYINEDMSKLHLMLQAPAKDMNFLDNSDAAKHGIHVMGDTSAEMIEATGLRARITGQ
jgi:hypothetical protein